MSLAYLLSILLLYSRFYTLHIPYSFYNLLLFISYHYFSDYVNFYHIFHISLRSAELILYYHIIYCHRFSHILSCAFIYYTFHIPFSFIYFMYFSCVHISCLIISHILFISSCTLLLILVHVYYHRIAVLCFSYYVIYSLHFICIYLSFFLCFMSANTLEVDIGNNCMYPKVLSLYEKVISICICPQVLSLYETVTYAM